MSVLGHFFPSSARAAAARTGHWEYARLLPLPTLCMFPLPPPWSTIKCRGAMQARTTNTSASTTSLRRCATSPRSFRHFTCAVRGQHGDGGQPVHADDGGVAGAGMGKTSDVSVPKPCSTSSPCGHSSRSVYLVVVGGVRGVNHVVVSIVVSIRSCFILLVGIGV
ncbi:hypothetical protein B0H10DRAFT_2243196 [Mycena sp. CBHHK59/15]|nr:hypothetical protein B0H10DRAFT_2243196 [Mycena sp. CBHHK59/15]